ncbi:MAG: GspH/FimT family protein [Chromatiales bacterium]|nr:GspH/FimT family protein [Chromatiales bacterium]
MATGNRSLFLAGSRGFSLLEMMLVLVLLGLIAALTPPLIGKVMQGMELQGAARELAAGLKLARSKAIAANQPTDVRFDLGKRAYFVPGQNSPRFFPEGVEIRLHTAQSETESDQIGSVRFFPDGTSTGGGVDLSMENRLYVIRVDWLTGQVEFGE